MTYKYNTAEEAILVIENDGEWYRNTINLPQTQEGILSFIHAARNVCGNSWRYRLNTASRAYVLFVLWEQQGKDTKILNERRKAEPNSGFAPFWEQHYKEQQSEINSKPYEKETKEMNPTTPTQQTEPAFQTRSYVLGKDAAHMSDDELIKAITVIEGNISALKAIKTKSTTISRKKDELKEALNSVVALLDSRV